LAVVFSTAVLTVGALCGTASAESVSSEACVTPPESTAQELMGQWNAALKTRHPDRVTQLFAKDGALMGFASPVPRTAYATIREYYLYFLQFEPQIQVKSSEVERGCNYLIDSGTYTWLLKSRVSGAAETRDARYRMIYERLGGQWRLSEYAETLASGAATDVAFAVPPPSPPRVTAAAKSAAPAVAGFLKRAEPAPKPKAAPAKPTHSDDEEEPFNPFRR
jgi:uncharacterized protein (TIGR02246 family)